MKLVIQYRDRDPSVLSSATIFSTDPSIMVMRFVALQNFIAALF